MAARGHRSAHVFVTVSAIMLPLNTPDARDALHSPPSSPEAHKNPQLRPCSGARPGREGEMPRSFTNPGRPASRPSRLPRPRPRARLRPAPTRSAPTRPRAGAQQATTSVLCDHGRERLLSGGKGRRDTYKVSRTAATRRRSPACASSNRSGRRPARILYTRASVRTQLRDPACELDVPRTASASRGAAMTGMHRRNNAT